MKLKYPVNLHKGATAFYVLALMFLYGNYSAGAWVYLALHGSYGFLWLLKNQIFPDKQWEQPVSLNYAVFVFVVLGLYWIAPWILIAQNKIPTPAMMGAAVTLNMFGVMLHFSSDAQKYFTLKHKPGLITEGFFSRCRNANYLGELIIYTGFAMLSMSWIGFLGITAFFIGAFIPNMLKKDKSLSRYAEFEDYKEKSGLLLPKLF
jgi:protein-S-isoprenylcysteine O-methyltransferase Ste14